MRPGGAHRPVSGSSSRRRARGVALQALYELDCTSHKADEVLARLVYDEEVDEETYEFVATLVRGVIGHRREIDAVIAQHAPAFPVDQMAVVDRNVLRLAAFELLYCADIPAKVAINEAIEIGKQFSTEDSGAFINGVLDSIRKKIEPQTKKDQTPS